MPHSPNLPVIEHCVQRKEQAMPPVDATRSSRETWCRAHSGARVLVLVAHLDVRVVSEDGELLRELVLDPSSDYQARAGAT
jgi:hypothetical protein